MTKVCANQELHPIYEGKDNGPQALYRFRRIISGIEDRVPEWN